MLFRSLFDAAATDLSDCFTGKPDFAPYQVLPVRKALFDAQKVTQPLPAIPQPPMDDPHFLEQQHREQEHRR